MMRAMPDVQQQQARLEEAFERIEETILPCIAMMLDTLLDASANLAELDLLMKSVDDYLDYRLDPSCPIR